MEKKQILILSLILIVLIVGVVVQQTRKQPELATEEYAPLDLSFDSAQVAKVEILKGKEEKLVELSKAEGGWKISNFLNARPVRPNDGSNGPRADQSKIESFLKTIREAKGELRSKDKALFPDFGMKEDEAYRVNLSDQGGASLLSLLIATKKPNYASVFVKKNDSDLIYLANADLFGQMGFYGDPAKEKPQSGHWTDLSLANFQVEQVERLSTKRFQDGREVLACGVVRAVDPADSAKRVWKYERAQTPFALDTEKIKTFLASLLTWKAAQAHDPKKKDFGFAKPLWQMKLGLDGGQEIVITAGNQDPDTKAYFMEVSNEPVVFKLTPYYLENMDIDDSKFFVDNPLSVNPDQTEKLVIHTPEKELKFTPKTKRGDALTNYLNDLKSFAVSRLLFAPQDQRKVQSPGPSWIEIQKDGEASLILDLGDILPAGAEAASKEYAAQKRGVPQPFAISEHLYKKLFEDLGRLAEPPSQPAAEPGKT